MAAASQPPHLLLPLLLLRPAVATSSRFPMARSKLLARQAALEEAARRHHLVAMEAQDRLHRLVELRPPALAALTLVLSVLLLQVMTPSAPARNVPTTAHHHLVTSPQHLEARRPIVETHLTPLATAAPMHLAPVLNALSPVAVLAATLTLPALNNPLVERPPFRSALSLRSAWPQWLPLWLSHFDRTIINTLGHLAKVRHAGPPNHDYH